MAEQSDVCKHCGGVDNWHHDLTVCVQALKAKLAQAMKVIAAADEMRSWYNKQMGPEGPEDAYDTERAKLKEMG